MMNTLFYQSVAKVFLLIILITIGLAVLSSCGKNKTYEARVKDARGDGLLLDNPERHVMMIGIAIPGETQPNFMPFLFDKARELFNGKTVTVRLISPGRKDGRYPQADLVEIYLNGENMNKYLLKNGYSFFFEDSWNNKDKNEYRELEASAKENGRGLWAYKDSLKVLYIRDKRGRWAYAPECPAAKEIKEENRIYYYTGMPEPFFGIRRNFWDECSSKIWESQAPEEEKKKLQAMSKRGWDELTEWWEKRKHTEDRRNSSS